jgi:glycosyltransferase involved in cell wall biosynthesis
MRVLITTSIFPPDIGGPATSVPLVAQWLSRAGHQVTVVTQSERLDHDDAARPYRVVRLPLKTAKLARIARTISTVLREARAADVVLVNGLAIECAVVKKLLPRKPMVQKIVGDIAWETARNAGWCDDDLDTFLQRRYGPRIECLRKLRTFSATASDRFIIASECFKRVVSSWGVPPDRIEVVHNTLSPSHRAAPSAAPRSNHTLLVAGRLISLKRYDQVIEAVAGIPGAHLEILGDGPEDAALRALAQRLGVADRIHFYGRVAPEHVAERLAVATAFVVNSLHESFPHVVLEAMAAGVPVIARPVGALPEQVVDGVTGYLVPGKDTDSLRRSIERLLSLSAARRADMGGNARRVFDEKFAFEKMMAKIAALLERMAKPH